jgi:chromosome segregation ATPase
MIGAFYFITVHFILLLRSALSDEESEAETLKNNLSNHAEELEIIKLELKDKMTTLAETQGELESLRNIVSDGQTQSDDVQQELQRVKEALMETQSVLGELTAFSL